MAETGWSVEAGTDEEEGMGEEDDEGWETLEPESLVMHRDISSTSNI